MVSEGFRKRFDREMGAGSPIATRRDILTRLQGTFPVKPMAGTVNALIKGGTATVRGTVRAAAGGTFPVRSMSGSVSVSLKEQSTMVAVDVQARYLHGVELRGSVRLGPGSIWKGTWVDVRNYRHKNLMFSIGNRGTSGGGSIGLMGGHIGTTLYDGTYTLRSAKRVGKGSPGTFYIDKPISYIRPWVRQHGSPASGIGEHGGTVQVWLVGMP